MVRRFDELHPPTPTVDSVGAEYREIDAAFEAADSTERRLAAVARWDALRRRLDTWASLVHLRFEQDTADEQRRQDKEYLDELSPKLTELDVAFKRRLLAAPHRAEADAAFGPQAAAVWTSDVACYEPAIEQEMVQESKLQTRYTELLASAKLEVRGQEENLATIDKYREQADRELREEAERVRWGWYAAQRQPLDELFDELVRLRDGMARKLGQPSFVELGYLRMVRIDYGRDDVARFRDAVRAHVTPLCQRMVERQREALGVEAVKYWDEAVLDPRGNPAPLGDHDWMTERAQEMFDALGHGLDDFYRRMREGGFMDLQSRPGKAGGGFCTSFASEGMPFIFANFNGTKGDVEVFTHEMGHAFQNYVSRGQPLFDYTWPTYESCEIHSMGLEFLTWPEMERFFGDDAERFRRTHLEQALRFLPYGVAVDHFQHLVYAEPEATPARRHEMWREMERSYLPWRDYGGLPHVSDGGFWQRQRHIYTAPFYYIDYALAQTCALQFWLRSRNDLGAALEDYQQLCQRGGEAPFQELAASAGLVSPLQDGCLDEVVDAAAAYLDLA